MFNHWDVVLDFVKACVRMTVIWVFSTILAIVLDSWGIRAENLLLVYLVGVLISILATGSLAWAFCAAFVFTFTFNYLFTEPKLTFHTDTCHGQFIFIRNNLQKPSGHSGYIRHSHFG